MGLPLYFSPSDSKPPTKSASKSGSASPSAGVRRLGSHTTDRRVRRAHTAHIERLIRRHAAAGQTEEASDSTEPLGAARRAGFRVHSQDEALTSPASPWSWNDDSSHRIPTRLLPRRFRDAVRDMARMDERRRAALEEDVGSLFGNDWWDISVDWADGALTRDEADGPSARGRQDGRDANRAHVPTRATSMDDQSPDRQQTDNAHTALAMLRHLVSHSQERSLTDQFADHFARASSQENVRNSIRRHDPRRVPVSGPRSRRGSGLDGLGDRDRSLSPEWDTLLTTLTPDAQPPSATSSFASSAASNSAVASSHSSPPHAAEGSSAAEPHCESGFEDSDGEDGPDYEHPDFAHVHRRGLQGRRANFGVPDYNLDGSTEGTLPQQGLALGSGRRQRHLTARRLRWEDEENAIATRQPITSQASTISGAPRSREAWMGRLPAGESENEGMTHHQWDSRDVSAAGRGTSASGAEDESRRTRRPANLDENLPEQLWSHRQRTLARGDSGST